MTDTRPLRRSSTLHDVAAQVGVSPRTVSRVVRDEGGFSEDTRHRVLAAVEQLNYRPNAQARSLISGRSGALAFVVPVLSDPFFPELAEGVQRAARSLGRTLLFAMSDDDCDAQEEILSSIEGQRPDGVVIFPAGSADALRPFLDRGMAMVVVDAEVDHPNAISVRSDLGGGTRMAVEHLTERGCRSLAMLDPSPRPVEQERRRAFLDAVPDGIVIDADHTMEGGRAGVHELLTRTPDVDGLFCFNDVMAIGAIQAIVASGRRVPEDIAVIGVDDIQMSSVMSPTLTTIRIDRERVGAEAVRQIIELTDGHGAHAATQPIVLPVELVIRESA